ncbi:MAG: class I SAM-dependent methyltransferase [Phycisphaerales bacterium]|nr:class I SAM-dependent methyltransferase [Phycisphaerales bacterium]
MPDERSSPHAAEPDPGLRARLKHLAFRMMRPGLLPVHGRLDAIEQELRGEVRAVADRLDMLQDDQRKYDSELEYWRWLIKRGGAEKDFGRSFEETFGHWTRQRMIKLGVFLGLPRVGEPGDIDDWAKERSVIEIGAGPYPSIASVRRGWLRSVAVDPIARGYVEEGLIAGAARAVVYIEAPGERIPLPANFADLLVIENCLDHVRDPKAVVREMTRLVRPGGYVWMFVDLSNHVDHMHPHAMNEHKVRALLEEFDIVRDEVTGHKAHPQAYGSYRGLLRRREPSRVGAAAGGSADGAHQPRANGAITATKSGASMNGSAAGRP